jgi:hypothetical protein
MRIRTDLSLGSDHHLIVSSLNVPDTIEEELALPTHRTWNLSRLHEDEPREFYTQLFEEIERFGEVALPCASQKAR